MRILTCCRSVVHTETTDNRETKYKRTTVRFGETMANIFRRQVKVTDTRRKTFAGFSYSGETRGLTRGLIFRREEEGELSEKLADDI